MEYQKQMKANTNEADIHFQMLKLHRALGLSKAVIMALLMRKKQFYYKEFEKVLREINELSK